MLSLQHIIKVQGAGRSKCDYGRKLQRSFIILLHRGAVEILAERGQRCTKLAQVLGRSDKHSVGSWLGNTKQANHSRLRKSSELKIVGGWVSVTLGDRMWLPHNFWVAAGLQGEGGPCLHPYLPTSSGVL